MGLKPALCERKASIVKGKEEEKLRKKAEKRDGGSMDFIGWRLLSQSLIDCSPICIS